MADVLIAPPDQLRLAAEYLFPPGSYNEPHYELCTAWRWCCPSCGWMPVNRGPNNGPQPGVFDFEVEPDDVRTNLYLTGRLIPGVDHSCAPGSPLTVEVEQHHCDLRESDHG